MLYARISVVRNSRFRGHLYPFLPSPFHEVRWHLPEISGASFGEWINLPGNTWPPLVVPMKGTTRLAGSVIGVIVFPGEGALAALQPQPLEWKMCCKDLIPGTLSRRGRADNTTNIMIHE